MPIIGRSPALLQEQAGVVCAPKLHNVHGSSHHDCHERHTNCHPVQHHMRPHADTPPNPTPTLQVLLVTLPGGHLGRVMWHKEGGHIHSLPHPSPTRCCWWYPNSPNVFMQLMQPHPFIQTPRPHHSHPPPHPPPPPPSGTAGGTANEDFAWWSSWEGDVAQGAVDGAAAAGGGGSGSAGSRSGDATAADEAWLATLDMQVRRVLAHIGFLYSTVGVLGQRSQPRHSLAVLAH